MFTIRLMRGFKVLDLMIVAAATILCCLLGLPLHANYSVRTKISEALFVARDAKTAITLTCSESPNISALGNQKAGFEFHHSEFVQSVSLDGPCSKPVISILTANTGAVFDPTLTITGDFAINSGRISWTCTSDALNSHLPDACRQ